MPVLKSSSEQMPFWSELDYYEIIEFKNQEKLIFIRKSVREVILVVSGSLKCKIGSNWKLLKYSEMLNLDENLNAFSLIPASKSGAVVRIGGNWEEPSGGSGVFTISNSDTPYNEGDATFYESQRKTYFDNHFHDCDEYWIIYKGSGKVATEETIFEVGAGNCVATFAGIHHDIIDIYEEIHGVYFETSLKGLKRTGHLWNKMQIIS